MDPIARRDFWDLIYQLSEAGHTIFVSTHYMDEAEYCHRLALMYRGRIIALGAPAELKTSLISHRLMNLESSGPAGEHEGARRAAGHSSTWRYSAAGCMSPSRTPMRPRRESARARRERASSRASPGADRAVDGGRLRRMIEQEERRTA